MSSAGKLGLTFKGKSVGTLKAGRYEITVVDRSLSRGFTLHAPGRPAQVLTGAALVGKRSRAITLTRGRWTFFSLRGMKSSFVVSSS